MLQETQVCLTNFDILLILRYVFPLYIYNENRHLWLKT